MLFLYIDPLKQGLKLQMIHDAGAQNTPPFLYIDPLKQGLKPMINQKVLLFILGFYT